jgi:hypothetical protein
MSQAVNLPGVTITSAKRSHPLAADKIAKRRNSGKFKAVTGKTKSSGGLTATRGAVFKHIRVAAEKYTDNSELSVFHYDIYNMVAGTWTLLQNFYMEHKEANTNMLQVSDQIFFINRFWLNGTMDNFASDEEVISRFASSHTNWTSEELANTVRNTKAQFEKFFQDQELISAELKSAKPGPEDFAQIQAELGPLVDFSASAAIATYLKKYKSAIKVYSKTSRRIGSHSLEKFLTLVNPSNVIYIGKHKRKGVPDIKAEEKVRSQNSKFVAPFPSLPYVFISPDPSVVELYLAKLRAHPELVALELSKPFFSQSRFAIHATDDEMTKLQKANAFLEELGREHTTYRAGPTTANIPYQQATYQQATYQPQAGTFGNVPTATLPTSTLQNIMGGLGARV